MEWSTVKTVPSALESVGDNGGWRWRRMGYFFRPTAAAVAPVTARISCRGDGYLRTLLIQGARSALQRAKSVATEKSTPEQQWIRQLDARMPFGKVLVAIANKHARQIWAMLALDVDYDPCAAIHHPMQRGKTIAA